MEDNRADVRLTIEALREADLSSNLYTARDGKEALALLRGEKDNGPVHPDLILLDLNLPRVDGREVLLELKQDEALKHIPVIVLTTSEADEDILAVYRAHANCYITKPVDLDQFVDVIRSIEMFWLTQAKLPTRLQRN